MVISQGDVFWVDFGTPIGSEPGYRRPCVVVQNDLANRSRIRTVLVCIVTSNTRLAVARGNVALAAGEANLTKPSVANVSQIMTVDKSRLMQRLGSLQSEKVRQIIDGIDLLIEPRETVPESDG